MTRDMTSGPVMPSMLRFALPMVLGNLLQQCYNIADTLIVGRFLGPDALAAVGSSFTLMTFLTSVFLGLCMGSGTLVSIRFGENNRAALRETVAASFVLIAGLTLALNILAFVLLEPIRTLLRVPGEVWPEMRAYLRVVFAGIAATFLYNYFTALLRAVGDSTAPLVFLGLSAALNIGLDLWFVTGLKWGVAGAAGATVAAQYAAGLGIAAYAWRKAPWLRPGRGERHVRLFRLREVTGFSGLTCVQQSVMNLGILLVQGVVNSFGPAVMAAFAAAVKIDAFAYMPVQDFGNAFSTFAAQNYGARQRGRIQAGLRGAAAASIGFCAGVSTLVWVFARPLMAVFVGPDETVILAEGVRYLRIEGALYWGIGLLFLLYGLYRALRRPGMSVVLTVASLGTRVALAYILSAVPSIGAVGIWWAVPIGWVLADLTGIGYYLLRRERLLAPAEKEGSL